MSSSFTQDEMLLLAMAEDAMADERLDPGFMDGEYKPFLAWSWEALVRPLAERGGWQALHKWRASMRNLHASRRSTCTKHH